MNDNTTKLLEQLAAKLGTTSEYLWTILLRQAPINATITLIQCVLIWVGCFIAIRLHFHFSDDKNKFNYDDHEGVALLMILVAIVLGVLLIVSLFSVEDIINGYFNPEFWALDHVLGVLKSK